MDHIPSILVIDDDDALSALLSDFFLKNNYKYRRFSEPMAALRDISTARPDLIILDVMLPGGTDGFKICGQIKATSDVPILMLSARGDVTDRIRGLEIGADDYLPKPFNPQELLVRSRKLIARNPTAVKIGETLYFDNLTLDRTNRSVTVDGAPVAISGSEFEVLYLIASKPGEIVDRDQISKAVAGQEWNAFSRSVDAIVSRLRSKLKDPARAPRFLSTVWGRGYVFIGTKRR